MRKLFSRYALSAIVAPLLAVGCNDGIFIDDFLANGNASKGVMDLCEKAGAKIEAMGFIIEKAFQHGGDFLRKEGIRYEALATVESLEDCKIVLK